MKLKQQLAILSTAFILVGCGNNTSESETKKEATPSSPTVVKDNSIVALKYTNKVVNNRGMEVEGEVGHYKIKVYSDSKIEANPQNIHKGVVVKFNGETSKVMPIEISYLDKNIMVGLYDKSGKHVATSDSIKITDVPVVVVELSN